MPTGLVPETPPRLPVTKTVIGQNGQVQQIQVDPVTGQEINLTGSGYDAINNGGSYWSPNIYNQDEEDGHDEDTTAQQVINPDDGYQRERASDPRDRMTKSQMSGPTNNFGYIDKPGWMGYMSNLPGMPGLIGKGVNAAVNTNNAIAMNKARDLMDIDPMGPGQMLGQIAKDKKGQVANVNIGNENYNVGFEALSPAGQTNLTPQEAQTRAGFMNTNVAENSQAFAKQDAREFQRQQQPQNKGFFSGIKDSISGFVDSLFGGKPEARETNARGFYDGYGPDSFPDAPEAPTRSDRDYSGYSRGDSPQADHAVDSGAGGLY